jgi:alpha/beta superfamily hydrolase
MKLEHLLIPSPQGGLEALLEWDPRVKPCLAAVACHPHPLHGGTMHNKVVFRAAKAASQASLPTLRFNFRGVGKSAGSFGHGLGEREDVTAALDYLGTRFPVLPVCLMGFSFGAIVGLRVGADDPRVVALVGLGVPVLSANMDFLRGVRKPKLIIQGTRDQFGPAAQVESFYASLAEPKQIHWVQNADHFFTGKLEEVQRVLNEFVKTVLNLRS